MDYNTIKESFFLSTGYDIAKFFVGYILSRVIYEKYLLAWRWGGWELIVKRGDKTETTRKLSPEFAKRIRTDENEFSVFVKGVVSPYERLKIDICLPESRKIGLIHIPPLNRFDRPRTNRKIFVDISKNMTKDEAVASEDLTC